MSVPSTSDFQPKVPSAELLERLDGNRGSAEERQIHDRLKSMYKAVLKELNEHVDDSREKSLAVTAFEESFMWVGKAVFRPDGEPHVSGQSLTQEKKPDAVIWDGSKNQAIEEWLGEDFVGWSNRNTPGPYPDEVVLTVIAGDVPHAAEVPKGAALVRSERGLHFLLNATTKED